MTLNPSHNHNDKSLFEESEQEYAAVKKKREISALKSEQCLNPRWSARTENLERKKQEVLLKQQSRLAARLTSPTSLRRKQLQASHDAFYETPSEY